MIAAGIGCRRGASVEAVEAAVGAALGAHGLAWADLAVMATGIGKTSEPGIGQAAARLGLPLRGIADEALQAAGTTTLTRSTHSLEAAGVTSLSEAAALAAAGKDARLLGPRLALGPVTCALASGGGEA